MGKTPQHILDKNRRWRERNREKVHVSQKKYYEKNKEKLRLKAKEYKMEHKEQKSEADKAYYRNYRRRKRRDVIDKLGGQCIQCGFGDWRGLQIDHVNGGGSKHRKEFANVWTYYKHIHENLDSGDYQVLCANCNQIRRYEEGGDAGA